MINNSFLCKTFEILTHYDTAFVPLYQRQTTVTSSLTLEVSRVKWPLNIVVSILVIYKRSLNSPETWMKSLLFELSQNGLNSKIPEFSKIHGVVKKCPRLHKHAIYFVLEKCLRGFGGAFSSSGFSQFTWGGNKKWLDFW